MSNMHLLCLACGVESVVGDDKHVHGCPECGNTNPPADLADAVDIHITKHELRILTIWATNYARNSPEMAQAMQIITDRLGTQTDVALTISQELADVRAEFPETTVIAYDAEGRQTEL